MQRVSILILLLATQAAASPPEFPAAEAWSYLTAQCEMGPRNPGSAGHAHCAEWIAGTLAGWGYDIEEHRSPRIAVPRGSTYYWRVRSKSKGKARDWCDPIEFRMQ